MKSIKLFVLAFLLMIGCRSVAQDNHEYVDLGLPSGTLWATCNVGATTPEGYGDYFAWGETQAKAIYDWGTYKFAEGDYHQMTKYCDKSFYGYNGFTDNLTVLQPGDDAATANWGSGWCIPSMEQWQELYEKTTVKWTTQNGVCGWLFTASNSNSLFLPAAGDRWGNELYGVGRFGYYWSSSCFTNFPINANCRHFDSDGYGKSACGRYLGRSVRAVRSSGQN